MFFEKVQAKILSNQQLLEAIANWRQSGESVVFTNGCFDILHFGHIHYLSQARDLGQRLIVGLNSDASVKRLKGEQRPFQDEYTRAHVLASLLCVDGVVIFHEDNPLQLIELILPKVLVKGGDWQPSQIVGSELVLANGGRVISLPYIDGHSTSGIQEKILKGKNSIV